MWPFRSRKRRAYIEGTGYVEVKTADDFSPAFNYANCLLIEMANSQQKDRVLHESATLPLVEHYDRPELPTFAAIANRLKVMANLDPVLFPEPRQGSVAMVVRVSADNEMHDFTVHLLFKDQGDREVNLRMEDRGPSPQYSSSEYKM